MKNKTTAVSIGSRIQELRKERRWTQVRLAALLGISQGHLSELEHGHQSFSAEQLLAMLKQFNVPLEYISPGAREGAGHLAQSAEILPTERLKNAIAAIREALVSADSARQVAAVAPVLVAHAGQINLTRLRNEFAQLGLENRFGWAIENTLHAIEIESSPTLPREWRLKYRRAALIIRSFSSTNPHPAQTPLYDVLDPEIASPEGLNEVIEALSPLAKKWRIATGIKTEDFVAALRGARCWIIH